MARIKNIELPNEKHICIGLTAIYGIGRPLARTIDVYKRQVFETSPSKEKINDTLAVLTPRKIDNGNSIKYYGKYYQPYLNGELKCFMPKTECLVIRTFNGELLVTIDEQVFELKELSRNEKFSKEFDEVIEVKEKKNCLLYTSRRCPSIL